MLFESAELELCAFASMCETERHSFQCIHSNPFLSQYLHEVCMKYECCFR